MRCTWCGRSNPDSSRICGGCGKDLLAGESAAEALRRLQRLHVEDVGLPCPACGALNEATARFCSLCSTPLAPEERRPRQDAGATDDDGPSPLRRLGLALEDLLAWVQDLPPKLVGCVISIVVLTLLFTCLFLQLIEPAADQLEPETVRHGGPTARTP